MLPKELNRASKNKTQYSLDIQNLSKVFSKKTLQKGGYTTLKSLLLNPLKHETSKSSDNIYAIKDLTLQIPRGKSVGIIGRNGAGKSTLLKLISGIYQPSAGSVKVNGKIAALIELGAGFHPDFTGRENIYLGGAMHGMTRQEIDAVFDDIVKFSELEDFIDAPIRTYSSGMFMRLGFSLAIHTKPDILIVDEVLAVGDASFNAKCKDRLFEIRKQGTTLLLVSHDLSSIATWCDEAIWIDKGEVKQRGIPEKVISDYLDYVNISDGEKLKETNNSSLESDKNKTKDNDKNQDDDANVAKNLLVNNKIINQESENYQIDVKNLVCLNKDMKECYAYKTHEKMFIKFDYELKDDIRYAVFEVKILRSDGLLVYETNTKSDKQDIVLNKNGSVIFEISDLDLLPAKYSICINIKKPLGGLYYYNAKALNFLVRSDSKILGIVSLKHKWQFN